MTEFFDYIVAFEDGSVKFFETYTEAWFFAINLLHENLRIYSCTDVFNKILEPDT